MKVGIVGTGYVGLVTGTCFAETGNSVTCVDIDEEKISNLQNGMLTIHEPGLQDLFDRNRREARLDFSTELAKIIGSKVIFLALPTPPDEKGHANLSYIFEVADQLGQLLTSYVVVVDKSTVPVGTAAEVRQRISVDARTEFDVISNPEFLREGQAVHDFMHPDRVVIGSSSERAIKIMKQLYSPVLRKRPERLIVTDEPSAELSKYAANAMLASRISFVNEIALLCERSGADVGAVRDILGTDTRIGPEFLYAGPGYGGSCFPKDTLALLETGRQHGIELETVKATIEANERQRRIVAKKVLAYYGNDIQGRTFALWGLAFKDNTDDIRESPALSIIDELTRKGARIVAFDPQAMGNVRKLMVDNPNLHYADSPYGALKGADALIIATNWKEFFNPDFSRIKDDLIAPVIFDGRNLYDLELMESEGFYYESIGRKTING